VPASSRPSVLRRSAAPKRVSFAEFKEAPMIQSLKKILAPIDFSGYSYGT